MKADDTLTTPRTPAVVEAGDARASFLQRRGITRVNLSLATRIGLKLAGINPKHYSDFAMPSKGWTRGMAQDFALDPAAISGPQGMQYAQFFPASWIAMPNVEDFAAELARVVEMIRQPLYGFKTYAAAGQATLTYFDQTGPGAGYQNCNLLRENGMAGQEAFLITAFRTIWKPIRSDITLATVAGSLGFSDAYALLNIECWSELIINEKNYLRVAPISGAPAGFGMGSVVNNSGINTAQSVSFGNNGQPDNKATLVVDPPVGLLPNRTFQVSDYWATVQAVVGATGKLGKWLDGFRFRVAQ